MELDGWEEVLAAADVPLGGAGAGPWDQLEFGRVRSRVQLGLEGVNR